MNKVLAVVVLVFISTLQSENLKAQGGFGGVHVSSEFFSQGNLLMFGGGGAWVINSNFYLGGAGYGGVNSVMTNEGELSSMGYGGFMFGYFKEVKNSVRVGSDILMGSGGYSVNELEDDFYFIEPNLKVWYSVNSFMHLSAGAYYRVAFLNADSALSQQDLNNLGIKLSLNFGVL